MSNPSSLTSLLARCMALAALALATGCASTYTVKVQSERKESLGSAVSYRLASPDQNPLYHDLYVETETLLTDELNAIGMREAASLEAADIVIQYRLSVEEHLEESARYRGAMPAIRTDPGRRYGAYKRSDGKYQLGEVATRTDFGRTLKEVKIVAYEKRVTLSAWTPETVLAGEQSETNTVWRARASVTDGGRDLYQVLPYLAVAAVDQLGSSESADGPQYKRYKTSQEVPDPYAVIITEVE